jgi:hypothetical protein
MQHLKVKLAEWEQIVTTKMIDVAPGGTIKTISEKLLTKVKTLPVAINIQIVIMIAGGICNLTVNPVIWEKVMLTEEILKICSSGIGPDQNMMHIFLLWKKNE